MRKLLLIMILLSCLSYFCKAQKGGGNESLEAVKIAWATKDLNLGTEEAQKFWPVYNKFISEVQNAKTESGNDVAAFQEKRLNIWKQYKPEFKQILNDDDRVNKVYTLEPRFHIMLKNEMNSRRQNGQMMQGFKRQQ